ncbi:MAG: ribose-5-phosphate isomerase RpiA [Rhodothermales bacterium]|nr:ribose-5-phosphate isomerase RpiA [Rhodothermales bacterium]
MDKAKQDAAKQALGEAAARLVEDGMRVGLGTGSTTALAIEAIGRRVRAEGLRIVGVPTSFAAERRARTFGIPLATLDDVEALDLAIDGADEVDPAFNLIKGGGAAHTREKIVAALAKRFVVLVDESKLVRRLGLTRPVPLEVLPMALAPVQRALERLGAKPELRMAVRKDGPVVTDQGFWIVDAMFPPIEDPARLAIELQAIPGVLDHGLFIGLAHDVLVAADDGTVRELVREA